MSSRRMGGITTGSVARARKAFSTQAIVARSSGTSRRRGASESMVISGMRGSRSEFPCFTGDDAGGQFHVVVVAAVHDGYWSRRADLSRRQRRDADRSSTFYDFALLEINSADRLGDLLFRDRHHVIDQPPDHRKGVTVVESDATAERIGKRGQLLDLNRMAGGKACPHGRAAFHADADHTDAWVQRL